MEVLEIRLFYPMAAIVDDFYKNEPLIRIVKGLPETSSIEAAETSIAVNIIGLIQEIVKKHKREILTLINDSLYTYKFGKLGEVMNPIRNNTEKIADIITEELVLSTIKRGRYKDRLYPWTYADINGIAPEQHYAYTKLCLASEKQFKTVAALCKRGADAVPVLVHGFVCSTHGAVSSSGKYENKKTVDLYLLSNCEITMTDFGCGKKATCGKDKDWGGFIEWIDPHVMEMFLRMSEGAPIKSHYLDTFLQLWEEVYKKMKLGFGATLSDGETVVWTFD